METGANDFLNGKCHRSRRIWEIPMKDSNPVWLEHSAKEASMSYAW